MLLKIKSLLLKKDTLNYIWVGLGQNLTAIFQVLSLLILIKYIGHNGNGIIIIVQTYWFLINDIISLQTISGVMKFLSDAIVAESHHLAKEYLKLGYLIDFSVGIFSLLIGLLSVPLAASILDWTSDVIRLLFIFFPVVLFRPAISGTSTAILRYLGKFKTISKISILAGLLRFSLFVFISLSSPSIYYYIIAEMIVEFLHYSLTFIVSVIIANKISYLNGFYKSKIVMHKNFLLFNLYNGLSLTSDLSLGHISNLIINKILGFEIISIYRVFEKTIGLFNRITSPIGQIMFPKIMNYIAKKNYKKSIEITFRYFLVVSGIGIVLFPFVFLSYNYWMSIFINDPIKFILPSIFYYIFTFLVMATDLVHILNISLGMVKQALIISVIVNIIYITFLYIVLSKYLLIGFIILKITQLITVILLKTLFIKRKIRENCLLMEGFL